MANRANFRFGPRAPLPFEEAYGDPTRVLESDPTRIFERATTTTSKCAGDDDSNLCEKPVGSVSTLAITLAVVIPAVIIFSVLIYLHTRGQKRIRSEDMMDPHKSLDFGLEIQPAAGGKKRKNNVYGGEKDANHLKQRQLSMDMDLSSPYLLPPQIQGSRESLNSLTRSVHESEDPYRPVTQYTMNSDGNSLRSYGKGPPSVYARSSTHGPPPPRQNSIPVPGANNARSLTGVPPPYFEKSATPAPAELPMPTPPQPAVQDHFNKETAVSELDAVNTDDTDNKCLSPANLPKIADLQFPAPAAQKNGRKDPNLSQPVNNHQSMSEAGDELFIYDKPGAGLTEEPQDSKSPNGASPVPARNDTSSPVAADAAAPVSNAGEFTFNVTSIMDEARENTNAQDASDAEHLDARNRAQHRRQSSEYPEEDATPQPGLAAPAGGDMRRMSVGFRPLPPDELIESEDPETRANRIRSFYKEYFDDKPDLTEYNQHFPTGGIPAQYRQQQPPPPQQRNNGPPRGRPQYQEPERGYLGDTAAYFDPDTNAFVMPYAQPVSRRAMTPPPSGSRFPGGRGPNGAPRNFHGSMSGMSLGPRPGSSVSNMRSASAMGKPKKPLPPPADLFTLPTPSKLKDDSILVLGSIDFAPPPSMADHVSGRPQSPMGERRPYQMKLPVSSPLVSAFEEMPVLPSPHMLRKSTTFTSLDFAPPKKFKDPELLSDAGSIRSNRSGISAVQQAAIRGGAGRVSRLPGDAVFTQADMANQLKPSWTQRG